MKINKLIRGSFLLAAALCAAFTAQAQRTKPKKPAATPNPIIFAVLSDGTTLEPIAVVDKGKLLQTVNGGGEAKEITAFTQTYYKPGTRYKLIFGSAVSGSVEVKKADPRAECFKNMAVAQTRVDKTPLKGLVMGLATNAPLKSTTPAYRRRPTPAEREEVEKLVLTEFAKQKVTPKTLRYHNLTALDLDRDGNAELVGSYWAEAGSTKRALLFFIADKDAGEKYSLGHHEFHLVDQEEVMSGDIKSVDDGVSHELLLDAFDYDGDGTSEVFTYTQTFEGAWFNVYQLENGKWVNIFEAYNYHCAF